MPLIVSTVAIIALFIAVLATFLFRVGVLLNRTAGNLDDCAQNVKNIAYQAEAIGPGVIRINETGTTVLGALPLLCDGAEKVAVAKGAPYEDPSTTPPAATPRPAPVAAPRPAPVTTSQAAPVAAPATAAPQGVGLLDRQNGSLGYLDAS